MAATIRRSRLGGLGVLALLGGCDAGAVTSGTALTATLSASPENILLGSVSTLSWSVTGARQVEIDQGIGTVAASGGLDVSPTSSTAYTLTASDHSGSVTASATVTVTSPPVIASFSASPATIQPGGSSVLSWSVSGATTVSIGQGVGAVGAAGQTTVAPARTTTYTLSASNGAGAVTATTTVSVAATAPAWLYTSPGSNHIYTRASGTEAVWMGRGVNLDDLFLCGYNNQLWMGADAETALLTLVATVMKEWKPTLVRVSLTMDSYRPTVSWLSNPSQYRDPMTKVVDAFGSYPGVYVLVTLRSDASMDCSKGEATCVPTASTDAVYQALVDSFRDAPHVIFGVANEPGGNALSNSALRVTMSHVVDVIRAREDQLGTPHHLVAVQGNSWSSSIGFYDSAPLTQDNVVYEYHSYPPSSSGYTWSNIPVIIGEYGPASGSATVSSSFFTDVESKLIPNVAWDLDPYSNCAPDLVQITRSSTRLDPTAWGAQVKDYLLAH